MPSHAKEAKGIEQPMTDYLTFPTIDPVIFTVLGMPVRWYGVMYLLGFFAMQRWGYHLAAKPHSGWNKTQVGDLMFYSFIGAVVGGRIGYVVFYQMSAWLTDPLYLLRIWTGGMSFHGGLIGVAVAMLYYGRKNQQSFLSVTDFGTPMVPIALAAGRIGNFINGELWGKTTDVPWAMVFPDGGPLPRHPSQLYELFLEGIVLFMIMAWFSAKPRPEGSVGGLILIVYGLFRFIIEFFREPDAHLGLLFGFISMGQLLSVPMVLIGGGLVWRGYHRQQKNQEIV
ncbi:MAG: phosphatidylglycerol:prolipoprotein diacylglycerol transferase [Phenylobacterium sp.]